MPDEKEECIKNYREIIALLDVMTPEQRAEFDERFSTLLAFIGEQLVRALDGSISREEFDKWMEAVGREVSDQ